MPPDLAKKYELCLPPYPGSDPCVELLSAQPEDTACSGDKANNRCDSPATQSKDNKADKENTKQ